MEIGSIIMGVLGVFLIFLVIGIGVMTLGLIDESFELGYKHAGNVDSVALRQAKEMQCDMAGMVLKSKLVQHSTLFHSWIESTDVCFSQALGERLIEREELIRDYENIIGGDE